MIDDFKAKKVQKKVGKHAKTINDDVVSSDIFRAPDEIAAEQTLEPAAPLEPDTADTTEVKDPDGVAPYPLKMSGMDLPSDTTKNKKLSLKQKLKNHWPPSKKELLIGGVVLLLLIAGVTTLILTHHSAPKPVVKAVTKPKVVVAPKPKTVASTLSGLQVDPSLNAKPVTGVMIENSLDARPQSGLGQASVVFEAVAEGGVTRFLALFQDTSPDNVGPIRSARPYYVSWANGFDAGYAHVGGSPDGLADIKAWNVRDLDQFANGGSYHRITTRDAPHNVYTSIATLNQLEASKGYTSSSFTGFVRKAEAPSKAPTVRTISMSLSGPVYDPTYTYNAATNSYNRAEDGAPHIDANTNTQISPKVVIAIVTPLTQGALDASGAYYSNYTTLGSGVAEVFQDGIETTGTWTKSANNGPLTFTDAAGKPLALNAGTTWITAVTSTQKVTQSP